MHRDGHAFPIDMQLTPTRTHEGLRILCTLRDVTRQKTLESNLHALEGIKDRADEAELSARERASQLEIFIRYVPAAIAVFDTKMRYLMVSNRWRQDYQLGETDIIGRSHYEVFPQISDRWRAIHRRCLAGESAGPTEEEFVQNDGRVEWVRWEIHPWLKPDDGVGGIILISRVISERKLAEARLRASYEDLERRVAERTAALALAKAKADATSAEKSWFMAAAGHDLRQPLQASLAYLSVLAKRVADPELHHLCTKARLPLSAMSGILDALLDIGQLDSGADAPVEGLQPVRLRSSDRRKLRSPGGSQESHANV